MFEKELRFFIENQDELVRQFDGRTLIIRERQVVGSYNTPLEAYLYAQEVYEPGSYMIQECEPGENAYTITISPALTFPNETAGTD